MEEAKRNLLRHPDQEKRQLDVYWDTGEKSRTVTPHLWNDYHNFWESKKLLEHFNADPNHPIILEKRVRLHELAYGYRRPLRIEDRCNYILLMLLRNLLAN